MSKELKNLIAEIKFKTKLTQEQIAQKVGYTRPYLSNAIKSDDDKQVIEALKMEFGNILQNVKRSDEIAVLHARVLELTKALAKLNEIVTKEPALDFYIALVKKADSSLIEQSGGQ